MGTGSVTQTKPSHKQVCAQAEKRPNTEIVNSSFGDEITIINKQLGQLKRQGHAD